MCDLIPSLNYDIKKLSLILRSIGFYMKSVECVKIDRTEGKEVQIDLTCNASGLKATFILSTDTCTCPLKPMENNNTFWEIQGTGPSTPTKKVIKQSSCNILPKINEKTSSFARSSLMMLLQHYRNEVEQETLTSSKEPLKSPNLQQNDNVEKAITPTSQDATSQNDNNMNYSSTPLNNKSGRQQTLPTGGFCNVTSVSKEGFHFSFRDGPSTSNLPKIKLEICDDTERVNANGGTDQTKEFSPAFGLIQTGIIFPSPQINNLDTDRDVYIIESISRARKELDAALLHLKCNIIRDLSECSVLKITPEQNKNKTNSVKQVKLNTRRRASIGSSEIIRKKSKERDPFQFRKPQMKGISSRVMRYKWADAQEQKGAKPRDVTTSNQEIEIYSTLVSVITSEILFYPLETILHRIQLQGTRTIIGNLDNGYAVVPILPSYEGAIDCYRSTIASEGFLLDKKPGLQQPKHVENAKNLDCKHTYGYGGYDYSGYGGYGKYSSNPYTSNNKNSHH